jgi:hypothetical protein
LLDDRRKSGYVRSRNLAVGAVIFIIGVGGHIGYSNGLMPIPLLQSVFPDGWRRLQLAHCWEIALNLILELLTRKALNNECIDSPQGYPCGELLFNINSHNYQYSLKFS